MPKGTISCALWHLEIAKRFYRLIQCMSPNLQPVCNGLFQPSGVKDNVTPIGVQKKGVIGFPIIMPSLRDSISTNQLSSNQPINWLVNGLLAHAYYLTKSTNELAPASLYFLIL